MLFWGEWHCLTEGEWVNSSRGQTTEEEQYHQGLQQQRVWVTLAWTAVNPKQCQLNILQQVVIYVVIIYVDMYLKLGLHEATSSRAISQCCAM